MPDRLFYIEGSWLTYEQAHNLGYSLLPQQIVTLFTVDNEQVNIKRDSSDHTYYDSEHLTWVDDFFSLGLYKYINNITCYIGESSSERRGYSHHTDNSSIEYILHNSSITSLNDLYETNGITTYKCTNIIVDFNCNPLVWYDSSTGLYFDDRSIHQWVNHIDDVSVAMYDSLENQQTSIYENTNNHTFFIDDSFVTYESFYSNDNYGIIRERAYFLNNGTLHQAYYDSYSDEYCIPNVTNTWLSKDDLNALGYAVVNGVADLWLCETPLHLPWKYLPATVTISFINDLYPELSIALPEDIEVSTGGEVILPEITGVYEDHSGIRWSATRWDIGEFNSSVVLNENTVTSIICEKLKATISFANPYYSSLDIQLPEPITVGNGDTIVLPTIEGEYEDEEHVKYTPYAWDIGQFNQEYILRTDTAANILCEKMKVILSFTNMSHPELEIPLPENIERHYGDTVILPRMRGVYRDEGSHPWIPLKWSLDEFDRLYTITESTSTDLVWQPLSEIPEIALCGSMPSDSGSSAETSDYIVLVAVGSMKLDLPDWPSTYLTDNYEVYSGQIEVWDSHYIQPIEPDFEKNSYTTSDQMICGTIRKWGVNDNSYIDFSMACGTIKSDPMKYVDVPLTDNYEIYSGRIKIWDSSYEQSSIDFPVKSGESSEQMYGGTIRKWGIYANHEILMSECTLIGNSSLDPMAYTDIKLIYNPEIYGDRLKVYDKQYTPTPEPEFPDKPVVEPSNQMYGGTIRLKSNKANRGIDISIVFDDSINPNDNWAPVIEEPINVEPVNEDPHEGVDYIDILLGIRWDPYNFRWLSKTFAADDWWWSGVLSSDDKTRLENFGLVVEKPLASGSGQTQNDWAGQIGGIYPDFANYTFKPIALYSDINGTQMNTADVSNFYCTSSDNWNNTVVLASINAYSAASASWLCRITKINKTITSNSDFIELLMGFKFPMGNSSPIEKALGSSYASILSEDDRSTIHRFGISTFDRDYVYGEIIPDFTKYVFEPIALYSDLSGTQQIEFDMSNIKLTASGEFTLYIHNEGSSVTAMTWKLRIIKL